MITENIETKSVEKFENENNLYLFLSFFQKLSCLFDILPSNLMFRIILNLCKLIINIGLNLKKMKLMLLIF